MKKLRAIMVTMMKIAIFEKFCKGYTHEKIAKMAKNAKKKIESKY